MTQQEFAELAGKDIKAPAFEAEYALADHIYLAAGDIDKQTFCQEYRKTGANKTICALTEQVEKFADAMIGKNNEIAMLKSQIESLKADVQMYEAAAATAKEDAQKMRDWWSEARTEKDRIKSNVKAIAQLLNAILD